MPCIVIRGKKICWIPDRPGGIQPPEEPLSESILDADVVVGVAPNDDLLSNTPNTDISNDLVSTTTTDSLGATDSLNEDTDHLGSVADPAFDTLSESPLDSIAIAEDTVTVDSNINSTFL